MLLGHCGYLPVSSSLVSLFDHVTSRLFREEMKKSRRFTILYPLIQISPVLCLDHHHQLSTLSPYLAIRNTNMSPTDSQPKPTLNTTSNRSPIRLVQDAAHDGLTLARLFVETLVSPLTDPSSWTHAPSAAAGSFSSGGSGGSRLGGGGVWFGSSGRGGPSGGSGGGRRLGTIAGLNGGGSECFVFLPTVVFSRSWCSTAGGDPDPMVERSHVA